MENTGEHPDQKDALEWYLSGVAGFTGPYRYSEVAAKLASREIGWADYCYPIQAAKWMRLVEVSEFSNLLPSEPKLRPGIPVPPPLPRKGAKPVKWFLFDQETQTGPYSEMELSALVSKGRVSTLAYVWQEEFQDWKVIKEVPEFVSLTPDQKAPSKPAVAPESEDRRSSPRKPLVARIFLTNQKVVVTGMCRDISVGGMQVLTDILPGRAGDSIQLNVLPPAQSGLNPFVAQGVIVRILEDQRGFSFRFTRIDESARSSIERYVS